MTPNLSTPPALAETVLRFLEGEYPEGFSLVRWVPLAGDASDRKYIRFTLAFPDRAAYDSYVLMQLAQPWVPHGAWRELPFINIARYLKEWDVPVPRIFVDASDRGMVLLEDVGDVTLEKHLQGCTRNERQGCYQKALEILVRMQKEAERASGRDCYALSYAFDAQTFFRELCFFQEHALEGLWGHGITETAKREMEGHFKNLSMEISGYPQRFTHRDYHARNLMVGGKGITVLDFQDARMGPLTYDLASLLRDSYVCLEPEEQQSLLVRYRDLCASEGVPLPGRDEFYKAFRRTGIQRNLKAIGTFAYQATVKGNKRYLSSIPNTLNSLRLALADDPDLSTLKRVLQDYLEGL